MLPGPLPNMTVLSPNTVRRLDVGEFDDCPLSDCPDFVPSDEDQEMVSAEEQLGTDLGENVDEGVMDGGPMDIVTGEDNMGANPENPEETRDPILPSTSTQQPQPTASHTGTLASAVEAQALNSPALTITMAQIREASAAGGPTDTDDEKA